MQKRVHRGPFVAFLAAAATGLLAGCFHDRPRQRIGSLPFPGLLTNFQALEVEDVDSLGKHQYAHVRLVHGNSGPEVDHGIFYTCRAGFLDLAHMRTAIDWTWYNCRQIRSALSHGEWAVHINGPDLTWWNVEFQPPSGWADMSQAERAGWIDEVSLRTGQRLAYLIQTWHEIATWHGHRISIVIPEELSAFTYDDAMSHLIGNRIAERAIRSGVEDYEDAVTLALVEELEDLEVVSREAVRSAVDRIHEDWWEGRTAGRHVDVGLDDGEVTPWLVQDLSECGRRTPDSFQLPWYGSRYGHEGRITVDSILLQVGAIRRSASIDGDVPIEEKHFPALITAIERELRSNDDVPGPDPPDGAAK